MPRSDRLFRLLDAIRRLPQPVTAERLAAETEVSPRSIYRDIAALRAAGARIDSAAGYGYTLAEDPALPPQTFDRLEIEALVLGLAEVGYSGDSDLAKAAERALAKITATLPGRQQREVAQAVVMTYRHADRPGLEVNMATIRAACWEERALDIVYRDKDGQPSHRRVLPLAIVFLDRTQMLLAWCCLRTDFRQFRLDRIAEVRPTADSFRPRRVAMLRDYIARLRGD